MRNNLKLNARLEMIAERIPHCRILVDIGTDHAYIPIYAVMNGGCSKSLAADLREGPLGMACANIKRYGLEKLIETRLGNGLEPIMLDECDVVVIAGMGGSLIRDILSSSVGKAQKAQLLLLQPNNAADVLRKWLCENGFEIDQETLVIDAGKLYCLLSTKWTGKTAVGDEFAYYIGNVLFDSGDPLLRKYVEKKVKELEVVISGRARSRTEKSRAADNGENESAGLVVDCVNCSPMHPDRMSILAGMDTEKCIQIRNRLVKFLESIKVEETT
jgi:tRNA (adenine22-N1)-methyltransferase